MPDVRTQGAPQKPPLVGSALGPFRQTTFLVIWTATVVANIGSWMSSAASSWLMTSLDPRPLVVSLVQVATTLPMFLLALPAGALADIVDRRRLLIGAEIAITITTVVLAFLVSGDLVTSANLLVLTFLGSCGTALIMPSWQAIVPQLVPKAELPAAIAANSVGVNISRAIGPAMAGVIIGAIGIAAPFWLNAAGNLAVIAALLWWRSSRTSMHPLPAERLGGAIRSGIRYARNNPPLRATLVRAVGFFLFASAYWALLPLVARQQLGGGPKLYGVLLSAIGAGAVAGAFAIPQLKRRLGPDWLVAAGCAGTALALFLLGLAVGPTTALIACLLAGSCWVAVLASLNVSAQVALPDWVRGRGLALFVTTFFGAMTLGSMVWGEVAALTGLPTAHFLAAAGALVAIPLTWRWKVQTGEGLDLTPSMHWPAPIVAGDVAPDRGPVLVTVEYRIEAEHRDAFLGALCQLGAERRRDGAYAWGIFEDSAYPGRFVETFFVESWLEHLRQHARVTQADRALETAVRHFSKDPPTITHLVAVEPPVATPRSSQH